MISVKLIVNVAKKMVMKILSKFQNITFFSTANITCYDWCIINIGYEIEKKNCNHNKLCEP